MAKRLAVRFEAAPMVSINMTPLVPVLLALFAVVAATLSSSGRAFDLNVPPDLMPPGSFSKPQEVTYLSVHDGRYFLGGDPVAVRDLAPRLKALALEHGNRHVYLSAGANVPYSQFLVMVREAEAADMQVILFEANVIDSNR